MSRYCYTGPNSAVTLKVSDGKGGLKDQDVLFWDGQEVDLPDGHELIAVLAAQGFLKSAAPVQAAPAAPQPAVSTDKSDKAVK